MGEQDSGGERPTENEGFREGKERSGKGGEDLFAFPERGRGEGTLEPGGGDNREGAGWKKRGFPLWRPREP